MMLALNASRPAQAQGRGAIGLELNAGLGALPRTPDNVYQPNAVFRDGLSAWYRLMPAFAMGASVGAIQAGGSLDGSNLSRATFLESGKTLEAFAEGRLFPSSFVCFFGRISAGFAHLELVPTFTPGPSHVEERTEPIFELEAGPELRLFFAPPGAPHRPDLFLRLLGTATTMPVNTFLGFGVSVGFEG